jgi:uncharacterized membrane protein
MHLLAAGPTSEVNEAFIQNDAVIAGILLAILGFVFWSSNHENRIFKAFYKVVPMLLLCYFLPSLLTAFKFINAEGNAVPLVDPGHSKLYFVASRYFLPASLVLLTISIDLNEVLKLGPKALIMFVTGTIGVVIGGPAAILICSMMGTNIDWKTEVPDVADDVAKAKQIESNEKFLAANPGKEAKDNPEKIEAGSPAVWRGLTTVSGSWIGGGANQAAMKEVFRPTGPLYSVMVAVDVIIAEIWMLFLLLGVGRAKDIDRLFKADASSIDTLRDKMEEFSKRTARIPSSADLMVLLAVAFGVTAVSHFVADTMSVFVKGNYPDLNKFSLDSQFFWLIVTATTLGIALSFTKARTLEGVGASRIGTVFIFFLVATIGLQMDITAITKHPQLFLVGGIWMLIHVGLLFLVGYLIRAPYFFLAVGSKANIGGAASAPVVAAAFHPSLAPVGVLLAVVGYALGTYGAYLCGLMMQAVAPG